MSEAFPVEYGYARVAPGVRIHYRRAGSGPPLFLVHGWPQTSYEWRKMVPLLAPHFTLIMPDLRGYGDSDRPLSGYDKRTMANDLVALAQQIGYEQFRLVGHDRGARVCHRLALDHSEHLSHLVLLDIVPTHYTLTHADLRVASGSWHWFFHLARDLPEALVAGREDVYLRHFYRAWAGNPAAIEEEAVQEYVRCFRQPGAMRAGFEDYRAGPTLDFEQDNADQDRKIEVPLLVLWGAESNSGRRWDFLSIWQERAANVQGKALQCGHFLAEEQPEELAKELLAFLT
jgi:haloacetate dehalogenase